MAYRSNDSGCGCLIAIFVVMAVISGIRSCTEHLIDGDLKLPKLGSGRVSGGSGGYGTSNGYNVKYNQTTSPNTNSSLRDYTHTNSQPTEYREGSNAHHSKSNSTSNTSSDYSSSISTSTNSGSLPPSSINKISTNSNTQKPTTYYKTCTLCGGTGKSNVSHWYYADNLSTCIECGRKDTHVHKEFITCSSCSGKGRFLIEKVNGPLGEMEIYHDDR